MKNDSEKMKRNVTWTCSCPVWAKKGYPWCVGSVEKSNGSDSPRQAWCVVCVCVCVCVCAEKMATSLKYSYSLDCSHGLRCLRNQCLLGIRDTVRE